MWHTPRFPGRIPFSPRDLGPTGSRRSSHRAVRPAPAGGAWKTAPCSSTLTVTRPPTAAIGSLAPGASPTPPPATRSTFNQNIHTITLTIGELAIAKKLDIEGPGANKLTISGNNNSRIFDIGPDATDVTIAGLTIADGLANAQSPNPFNFSPTPSSEGGGILNLGTLTSPTTSCGITRPSAPPASSARVSRAVPAVVASAISVR